MLLLKIKKLTAHNLKIDCTNKLLTSHFCVDCTLARPLVHIMPSINALYHDYI